MAATSIGDALFTKTQKKVLGLLFGKPDKRFYTNEIMRWASMGRGTVGRELERLVSANLLTVIKEGNQNYYQANANNPVYRELVNIVKKSFGLADVIKQALILLSGDIKFAFIFGSIAKRKENEYSDIDIMIIGEVTYANVVKALHSSEKSLGREINPKIFNLNEWKKQVKNHREFFKDVMEHPKLFIKGDENDFKEFNRKLVRKN